MKKALFLILALLTLISCAGCRGYVTSTTPNGTVTDGNTRTYTTDGTVRDYTTNYTAPNTNARLNDNIINGTRNDLTRRPNARPYQAGTMDYQGTAPY
ncbi:hypothetical protein SDC9_184079 [bioreactor metagenome]|uniref:Lipoprotein n=1 Tax=bioreactor metagenome TaxID=1076179 RepID=A0A645HCX1_9ZZZZ